MSARNRLRQEYDQRRLAREVEIRRRKLEVYELDDKFKELERTHREVIEELIQAGLDAGLVDEAIDLELASRHEAYYDARAQLLKQHDLPTDYLDPGYQCNDCQDTGRIGAEDCHCFKQALAQEVYKEQSLLESGRNLSNWTSDIFADKQRENAETIHQAMLEYVSDMKSFPGRSLIFQGVPGVGKTYLSTALAGSLAEQGLVVIYQTAPDLFDVEYNQRQSHKRHLLEADMLIIDDLGKEALTDYVRSNLFNLINHRVRMNKAFLISTNLTLRELKSRYQDDIFTRLTAVCEYYEFMGPELRSYRSSER